MSIQSAYTQWSTSYDKDRNLTRDLDQLVTTQVLTTYDDVDSLLELGCGTGKNTPFLASLANRVYAFDFSEGMLAQAMAKAHARHVSFGVADINQPLPVESQVMQLVTCNLVLEHIRHLEPLFKEIYRVLTRGGTFFLSELHPLRQYEGKKARFNQGDRTVEIDAYLHHLSDFTECAYRVGFQIVRVQEWWHDDDEKFMPRLLTCVFRK